jgi:hypothetical protein
MTLLKHSFWFLPVLLFSMAMKFQNNYILYEDYGHTLRQAATQLEQSGFHVVAESIGNGRLTVEKGGCKARLRLMDSHGTADSFYRSTLAGSATIRYAWRGGWRETRPWAGPLLEYYLKREFVRRGMAMARSPAWVVGLGAGCGGVLFARFSTPTLPMQPRPAD